jgi:hypothetical protein
VRGEGWADREEDRPYFCAHCGRPITGVWIIEIDGAYFHAATMFRGRDRRRCRDVAESLRVAL